MIGALAGFASEPCPREANEVRSTRFKNFKHSISLSSRRLENKERLRGKEEVDWLDK
jgi:hypothetical protein